MQPRANNDEITGIRNGRLQIRTTAAPIDGKANSSVVKLLARGLGIAPSRIEMRRGKTQRDKLFLVKGLLQGP